MAKLGERKKNAKARTVRERAYGARPEQKKNRAARNKARRQAIREGRVKKGDGKHVDHVTPLKHKPNNNNKTRVVSAKKNTSEGARIRDGKRKKR